MLGLPKLDVRVGEWKLLLMSVLDAAIQAITACLARSAADRDGARD